MTDLDRAIRDLLDAAGTRAVAPPFEGVRRRHTRRRARQVTTASVALAAAVATVAVAAPGGSGGGGATHFASQGELRPWPEATADPDTLMLIGECTMQHSTIKPDRDRLTGLYRITYEDVMGCYAKYGFEGPPESARGPYPVANTATEDPRADGTYACDLAPGTDEVTIASGRVEDVPWRVVVWQGRNDTWCSSWRTAAPPNTQLMHADTIDDFGRVGAVRRVNELSWTVLEETKADGTDVVVWGAVRPEVATVRFVTRNGTHDVATVALPEQPDRRWVGAHVPDLGDVGWHAKYLDASGNVIGRLPALP